MDGKDFDDVMKNFDGELGNLTDDEITNCIDRVGLNAAVTAYSEAEKNPG